MRVGTGGDYEQLDEALRDLIAKGERDICICLLHGDQETGEIEISGYRDLHIQIAGCGPGSRVMLLKPIKFSHVNSVVLRDLAIETAFVAGAAEDEDASAITFDHCVEVSLRACHLSGVTVSEQGCAALHRERPSCVVAWQCVRGTAAKQPGAHAHGLRVCRDSFQSDKLGSL